jgi:hypothetical protein
MTTDRQFTPTEHSSVVGGSTAARVLACPASVKLVQKAPPRGSSEYADEGTALHEAIEHALSEGFDLSEVQDMVGMEFYGHTLTADMVEGALVPAWIMWDDYYEKLIEEDGDVLAFRLESKGVFPGIDGAFGTTDIIGFTPKRSFVWDWKFGAGVPVSATENKQMMFYGVACGDTHPAHVFPEGIDWGTAPEGWRFDLIVAQPRINDMADVWETDIETLDDFIRPLQDAVEEALWAEEPTAKRGEHCRWCDAQPFCPLYKDVSEKLAALVVPTETDKGVVVEREDAVAAMDTGPHEITPELLRDWLHKADIAEAWAKSIRKLAMEQAEAGHPPAGLKLVKKHGNLSYLPEVDPDQLLKNRGLSVQERRKVTPITPTQANKILKKMGKKELGEKYTTRPFNGYTLAPKDDPREGVRSVAEVGQSVADKLARATGAAEDED